MQPTAGRSCDHSSEITLGQETDVCDVCARQCSGLLVQFSILFAVDLKGGMKHNIAYWPADDAASVTAWTNRSASKHTERKQRKMRSPASD